MKNEKKASQKRREEVASFLCRDENSHMLSGKKDTITAMRHLRLSYRQFVRYCPFFITPAKD